MGHLDWLCRASSLSVVGEHINGIGAKDIGERWDASTTPMSGTRPASMTFYISPGTYQQRHNVLVSSGCGSVQGCPAPCISEIEVDRST